MTAAILTIRVPQDLEDRYDDDKILRSLESWMGPGRDGGAAVLDIWGPQDRQQPLLDVAKVDRGFGWVKVGLQGSDEDVLALAEELAGVAKRAVGKRVTTNLRKIPGARKVRIEGRIGPRVDRLLDRDYDRQDPRWRGAIRATIRALIHREGVFLATNTPEDIWMYDDQVWFDVAVPANRRDQIIGRITRLLDLTPGEVTTPEYHVHAGD